MGKVSTLKIKTFKTANTPDQLSQTIKLIGKAIQSGSLYMPLRHLAARAATRAPAKDYWKQIQAVYDAITQKWWRYTFDPVGAEVLTLDGPRIYSLTLGSGSPDHRGYGDCDDMACAAGSLLRSIGFKVLICCTAPPGCPYIFNHVFIKVKPPKARQWLTFDPVLYPKKPLGSTAKHERIACFDLNGRLVSKSGQFPPRFSAVMEQYRNGQAGSLGNSSPSGQILGGTLMGAYLNTRAGQPRFEDFHDYGDEIGYYGETVNVDENDPIAMRRLLATGVLRPFDEVGMVGFGGYSDIMGSTPGDQVPHIMAQYDETDEVGNTGLVRTKHFELDPIDYAVVQEHGVPMTGALALADDGEVYRWTANPDGMGGFFKKLFKKARKVVKKVGGRIKRVAKKIITKLPFGKKLWAIGSKIHRTAMKIAKGLLKKIGPIAMKIAPIAALVPGIGTAVAGALMVTGKVYKIAKKMGVKFDSKKRPIIKNKATGKAFSKMLAKEGRRMGKGQAASIMAKVKGIQRKKKSRRRGGGGYRIQKGMLGADQYYGEPITDGEVYSSQEVNSAPLRMASVGFGWA